jgi:hypothetical protein
MPPKTEAELLAELVKATEKVIERPQPTLPVVTDQAAAAEEEARRLALLRNPTRRY